MPKPRNWTDQDMLGAIQSSTSIRETIIKLGLVPAGGNYVTVKNFISDNQVNTDHFKGQGHNRGTSRGNGYSGNSATPLQEILVKGCRYKSSLLRQRLIDEGVFNPICTSCKLDTWLDEPIPLELDHINGDCEDQRLANLRLLCPNCHAKTPTYRGKNIGK